MTYVKASTTVSTSMSAGTASVNSPILLLKGNPLAVFEGLRAIPRNGFAMHPNITQTGRKNCQPDIDEGGAGPRGGWSLELFTGAAESKIWNTC